MSKFDIAPLPVVFCIDPNPFDNENLIQLINNVSEIKAHPISRTYTGNHPDQPSQDELKWHVSFLFGRIVTDKIFIYLFAKVGNQLLKAVLDSYYKDFREPDKIVGYVFNIDARTYAGRYFQYNNEAIIDYVDYVKNEYRELRSMIGDAPCAIGIMQPINPSEAIPNIRQIVAEDLKLEDDTSIFEYMPDGRSFTSLLTYLFLHQKLYDQETSNYILHNLRETTADD